MIALLALGALLSACGGNSSATPTPRPPTPIPPTPTPRSTPLPALAEPPALLGSAARPLTFLIGSAVSGDSSVSDLDALAQAVADALQPLAETLDLAPDVEVQVEVTGETEALRAACSGAPVLAWVSAYTYVAAERACDAEPLLAIVREEDSAPVIGTAVDVVTRADTPDIDEEAELIFCRVEGDASDWAFATLLLQAEYGITLEQIQLSTTFEDTVAALRGLTDETCDVLALPPGSLDSLVDDLADALEDEDEDISADDLTDAFTVAIPAGDVALADASDGDALTIPARVLPFGVLIAPQGAALPASEQRPLRQEIVAAMQEHFDDTPRMLESLLSADDLAPVDSGNYAAFRRLLDDAGWSMAPE